MNINDLRRRQGLEEKKPELSYTEQLDAYIGEGEKKKFSPREIMENNPFRPFDVVADTALSLGSGMVGYGAGETAGLAKAGVEALPKTAPPETEENLARHREFWGDVQAPYGMALPVLPFVAADPLKDQRDKTSALVEESVDQLRRQAVMDEYQKRTAKQPWYKRVELFGSPRPDAKLTPAEEAKEDFAPSDRNIFRVLNALDPQVKREEAAVAEGHKLRDEIANAFTYQPREPESQWAMEKFGNVLDTFVTKPAQRLAERAFPNDPVAQDVARVATENAAFLLGVKGLKIGTKGATIPARAAVGLTRDFAGAFGRQLQKIRNTPLLKKYRGDIEAAAGIEDLAGEVADAPQPKPAITPELLHTASEAAIRDLKKKGTITAAEEKAALAQMKKLAQARKMDTQMLKEGRELFVEDALEEFPKTELEVPDGRDFDSIYALAQRAIEDPTIETFRYGDKIFDADYNLLDKVVEEWQRKRGKGEPVRETVPPEESVAQQPEVPREDPSLTRAESEARRREAQQRAAKRPELPKVETPERPAPLSEAEKAAYLKELEQKRAEAEAQRKAAEEIDFGQMTEGHTRKEVEEFARQAIADPTIKRVFVDGKEFAAERGLISKLTSEWSKARRDGKKEVVPEPERQVENRGVSEPERAAPVVEETPPAEPVSEVPSDNPFAGLIEDPASAEGARVYHQDLLDFAEGTGIKEAILDPANNLKKLKKEIPRLLEEKGIKIDDLRKEDVVDIIDAVKLEAGKITGPRKKLYAKTLDHIQKHRDLDPEIFDDFDQQVRALRDLEEAQNAPEVEGREAGSQPRKEGERKRPLDKVMDENLPEVPAVLRIPLEKAQEEIRRRTSDRSIEDLIVEENQSLPNVLSAKKKAQASQDAFNRILLAEEDRGNRDPGSPIDKFDEAADILGEKEVDPDTLPGEVKKVSVEEYLKEQEAKKETPKQMTSMSPNQFHSFLGVPPQAGRMLRKIMGAENRARGKGDGSINSRVLRSVFWRGQKTSPKFDEKVGKWYVDREGEFKKPVTEVNIGEVVYYKLLSNDKPQTAKLIGIKGNKAELSGDGKYWKHPLRLVSTESAGRKYFDGPPTANHFVRSKARNFGEPGYAGEGEGMRGVSMSLMPHGDGAERFSKQLVGDEPGVVRVMPLYGTEPEKVILDMTKPEHREVMKGAYKKAVAKTGEKAELKPDAKNLSLKRSSTNKARREELEALRKEISELEYKAHDGDYKLFDEVDKLQEKYDKLNTQYMNSDASVFETGDTLYYAKFADEPLIKVTVTKKLSENNAEILRTDGRSETVNTNLLFPEDQVKKGFPKSYDELKGTLADDFNRALTEELESQGYKGILHSPHRYGEFELQIFNPKDVLFLEEPRGVRSDPAIGRMWEGRPLKNAFIESGKEFYPGQEVEIVGKAGVKVSDGTIVGPGEDAGFIKVKKPDGTVDHFSPKFIARKRLDEKGISRRTADEWSDYTAAEGLGGKETSALGAIYKSIDFQKLADLLKADPDALGSNFSNLRLLRHLERRADELGTKIRDLLVKEGVPLKYAIRIEKEAKTTAREVPYDPTVPGFTPASQHSTGPIINQAEREVAIENGEPPPPPLYEGEARAIGDMVKDVFPDLRGKGSINKILKGLQTAPRLLRKYGKEGQRLFHGTINNAEINGLLRAQFYAKEIESIRKQHKMTPLEEKQVGIVQYSLSERGRDMLAESGVEPMRYDQLSPKQKAAYDFFEEMYARFLVDVNEARAAAGKGPIKAVNGYAPLFTDWALATDAQFRKFDLEHIRKKAKAGGEAPFRHTVNPLTFEQDLIQRASTRPAPLAKPGHTLKRAAKGTYPIKINPFLNAKAYVNTMGPYIDMTPAVAKVNQFLGKIPQKYLGVEGKAGETRTFRIADFDPEFADAALRYLTDLSLGRNNAPWSSLGGGDALSRQIMGTLKNVAAATLGFSLRAGVIQPTAYANIAAMLSIDSAMTGIKKSFSKADRLRIERNVKELQIAKSSFDATKLDMEELYSDWKIGRARDKINNYGFIPLQVMDYYTRVAAALAAEHEAKFVINPRRKANGLSEMAPAEIYEYAGEMVRETQGSGLKSDRAAIQRNIAGKVMTLFQTFTINQANLIFSDLLGIKNPNVSAKMAAERTIKYLALTSAATAVYEMAGFNSPMVSPVSVGMELVKDQETSEKVFGVVREIMQDLPILSSATYGGTAGGALWDMWNDVVKMLTGQLPVGKGAATTAMKLGGVPATKVFSGAFGRGDVFDKAEQIIGMKQSGLDKFR